MIHKAVLLKELTDCLEVRKGGIYVDLTLGAGGHSLKILEELKEGTLIGFDLSFKAIDHFHKKLVKEGFEVANETEKQIELKKGSLKIILVNRNFTDLADVLSELNINSANGIIADLGWSSDELTEIEGLSYDSNVDDYLDMRFDKSLAVTAADLLNALGRSELSKMFERYADVYGKSNQNLVSNILTFRKKGAFNKVRDLKLVIDRSFKFKQSNRFQKNEVYKTYSRVFQALRIAVNSELVNLEKLLESSLDLLVKNGSMGIITFHSGEDKVIVSFLESKLSQNKVMVTSQNGEDLFIRPSVEEIKGNIRARSAKLYIFKKL
ncbi:Ribosomal RNA small subunit methyltransferase H [Patescibacteria group bacterium]|nr:Ribosomal RNA small subunit methyltransferase H [Patescibacteria group bacterium]